ncbi:MAG TPA: (d)CMP kinase [Longimicrobiales bacterium]|nr:(d)CMP kinase [Longimicrobiales bacterium]
MIIAIDGPAGSGKSTTAREAARRLGFHHVDSGAFYRALTWAALEAGIAPERFAMLSEAELDDFGVRAEPEGNGFRMFAGGRDVEPHIREAAVTASVSAMARVARVRTWLNRRLRDAASRADVVVDGRDIGTVVFPDADLKIFLVAHPETRARRRLAEWGIIAPSSDAVAAEVERLLERDRADSEREVAPLVRAADAEEIDTSLLDFEEQVERVVSLARARGAVASAGSRGGRVPPRG